jgi:hypothetical protein
MNQLKMSPPTRVLIWMAGFLVLVAVLCAIVWQKLADMFAANPFFNSIILLVLLAGIIANIRQVLVLAREVTWIDGFRRSSPDSAILLRPRLLAPMARMLTGREPDTTALSAPSVRTMLDSVQLRLEESRDLSRYLIGLAVFLGLLGTFWGLLVTIRSVTDIIGSLSVGSDAVAMFTALKENIKVPLGGMSTSFSTSLFGLSSSLIIGFLDLQAGHVQNRFYNELEEWLSEMVSLSSGTLLETEASIPAYVQALLEKTADGLERMQRAISDNNLERQASNEYLAKLSTLIERLNELMSLDARERHTAVTAQDELRTVLRQLANQPRNESRLTEDLRAEFRLLSRTIAAAMELQGSRKEPRQ